MGKKERVKHERRDRMLWDTMSVHLTNEGLHCSVPLTDPKKESEDQIRAVLQNHVKHCDIWLKLVELYGKSKAEDVLTNCKIHINTKGEQNKLLD